MSIPPLCGWTLSGLPDELENPGPRTPKVRRARSGYPDASCTLPFYRRGLDRDRIERRVCTVAVKSVVSGAPDFLGCLKSRTYNKKAPRTGRFCPKVNQRPCQETRCSGCAKRLGNLSFPALCGWTSSRLPDELENPGPRTKSGAPDPVNFKPALTVHSRGLRRMPLTGFSSRITSIRV